MNIINKFYGILALLLMGSASLMAQTLVDPFPEVDCYKYADKMTLVCQVREKGVVITDEAIVAVYHGDELRGKGRSFSQGEYQGMFVITIWGETKGEELRFKVCTSEGVVEVNQVLTYTSNTVVGQVGDFYYINLLEWGDVNLDGIASLADVTYLVNIIKGNVAVYSRRMADVNKDGEVTTADVESLVNVLLEK